MWCVRTTTRRRKFLWARKCAAVYIIWWLCVCALCICILTTCRELVRGYRKIVYSEIFTALLLPISQRLFLILYCSAHSLSYLLYVRYIAAIYILRYLSWVLWWFFFVVVVHVCVCIFLHVVSCGWGEYFVVCHPLWWASIRAAQVGFCMYDDDISVYYYAIWLCLVCILVQFTYVCRVYFTNLNFWKCLR